VSAADLARLAEQIDRVYRQADYVGSLVVEGDTGRPTEHGGPKWEPPGWWEEFWQRHFQNTGQTREEAAAMLDQLLGRDWTQRPRGEVEDALRKV
jgi:hypothetical protein